jgi:predicted nucleotidyltransferase
MVSFEQISALADQIAIAHNPEKIILFGSYAYGNPNKHSDVDFFIVMPFEGRVAAKASEIAISLDDIPFPLDLIVRTPEMVSKRIAINDSFIREIMTKGKTLYERRND